MAATGSESDSIIGAMSARPESPVHDVPMTVVL